jgi:hypothetical protein
MHSKNKILFSSETMKKYLTMGWYKKAYSCSPLTINVENNQFSICELQVGSIGIQSETNFTFETNKDQLDRMRAFLDIISEQPVCLCFGDNGWIWIREAII